MAVREERDQNAEGGQGLLAVGSVLAALGASSCCALPLIFFSVGVGGAWIAYLTALSPYQPLFLAATLALLAVGFWRAYRQPKSFCESGCGGSARLGSDRAARIGLWAGAALILAAVAVPHAATLFL